MKEYSVDIDKEDILTEVYRLSANAAKERGDVLHVATADNADVVERLLAEGMGPLVATFGRYFLEYIGWQIKFSMPENWSERLKDAIEENCRVFLINFTLGRWFALSGVDTGHMQVAGTYLNNIKDLLTKRYKLQR